MAGNWTDLVLSSSRQYLASITHVVRNFPALPIAPPPPPPTHKIIYFKPYLRALEVVQRVGDIVGIWHEMRGLGREDLLSRLLRGRRVERRWEVGWLKIGHRSSRSAGKSGRSWSDAVANSILKRWNKITRTLYISSASRPPFPDRYLWRSQHRKKSILNHQIHDDSKNTKITTNTTESSGKMRFTARASIRKAWHSEFQLRSHFNFSKVLTVIFFC